VSEEYARVKNGRDGERATGRERVGKDGQRTGEDGRGMAKAKGREGEGSEGQEGERGRRGEEGEELLRGRAWSQRGGL